MVERLVITTMGKQTLRELLEDRVFGALYNLSLDSSDEKRVAHVVSSVMSLGKFEQIDDHGDRYNKASHQ